MRFCLRYPILRLLPHQELRKPLNLRVARCGTYLALLAGAHWLRISESEKIRMKRISLVAIAVFALVMLPAAFGQSTPSPSQDPAMQPSTSPSQQTPSQTNPSTATSPTTDPSSSASSSDAARSFVGSIVKASGKYVLHTGGTDYQLDDQSTAKKFEGKDVKVTGQLDASSNTIKVQSIDPASSM
jgi:hypothetical protein